MCLPWQLGCQAGNIADALVGDAIENMQAAVEQAVGQAVGQVGTMWVSVETPVLSGSGSTGIDVGPAPGSAELAQVLGYLTWVGFAVAIVSLIVLGVMVARGISQGQGAGILTRGFWLAAGVLVLGGGAGIVGTVMPSQPANVAGAAAFLQSSLWFYTGVFVVLSVIIGGIRMVLTQRADAGRDVLRSLFTFLVVSAMGVTVIGLLVVVSDRFSVWLLSNALSCDVEGNAACFGENLVGLLGIATEATDVTGTGAGALVPLMAIVVGLLAVLAALVQVVLMLARGGLLVLMAGLLPTVASFTSTETGRSWFWKAVSWTGAFILYKPVAAILYATGFQLVGTEWASDDALTTTLTGLLMMVLAVVALPAMMRFVTPVVGAAVGGAGGGALAAGALAAIPSGAAAISRTRGGGSADAGAPSGAPSSAKGAPGPGGSSGTGSSGPQGPGGASSQTQPSPTSGGSGGSSGSGGSPGQGASPAPAGGASGAGGVGAGAGATGAGAGAAASKAHPALAAARVAADGAKAAGAAVKQVGENASGESGGPSGSN